MKPADDCLSDHRFGYTNYESMVRLKDAATVQQHRAYLKDTFLSYIEHCRRVIELACGQGLFLDVLRDAGIQATGVDADPEIVRDARARGHRVIEADAVSFPHATTETFDGAFCSHLIEHLPFDRVCQLISGVSRCLESGGIFVLAFPNPRSLPTHLYQFWRDPQHVRFYDSELIEGVLKHAGFEIVFNSDNVANANPWYTAPLREEVAQLLQQVSDLPHRSSSQLDVLIQPAPGATAWRRLRSRCGQWLRDRVGVPLLIREIADLNDSLSRLHDSIVVIHRSLVRIQELLDPYDMEVRLVSRRK